MESFGWAEAGKGRAHGTLGISGFKWWVLTCSVYCYHSLPAFIVYIYFASHPCITGAFTHEIHQALRKHLDFSTSLARIKNNALSYYRG